MTIIMTKSRKNIRSKALLKNKQRGTYRCERWKLITNGYRSKKDQWYYFLFTQVVSMPLSELEISESKHNYTSF